MSRTLNPIVAPEAENDAVTGADESAAALPTLPSLPGLRDPLGTLRIQIFPHVDKYTTPQGSEKVFDRLKLRADPPAGKKGRCSAYVITGEPAAQLAEPSHGSVPVATAVELNFDLNELPGDLWVECNVPAILVRDEGLKAYRYPGKFHVREFKNAIGARSLQVINYVSFSDYLKGVVPAEIPASWGVESLRAQAVAARTYAYQSVVKVREESEASNTAVLFDLDDTVFYQAYSGTSNSHPNTDHVVEETRGQILTFKGQPIVAYFSADSGGYTEDAANVWNVDAPYCRAKAEIFDLKLIPKPWKVPFTQSALNAAFVKARLVPADKPVQNLRIDADERFPSGRASIVHAMLSDGSERKLDAQKVQQALKLKSTLFEVQKALTDAAETQFVFDGRGFGHGAGMSQWGAKALAEGLGWKYPEILHFYYTDVVLCTFVPADVSAKLPACAK